MYHIKKDKRSCLSARLIAEAMLELLKEKEFEKISIVDIQKKAEIGRNTFYRLFDRPEDVLLYIYNERLKNCYEEYMEILPGERPPIVRFLLERIHQHDELLPILLTLSQTGMLQAVYRDNQYIIKHLVSNATLLTPVEEEYFINLIAAAITSVIDVWIRRGRKENVDELYDIFLHQATIFRELV